LGLAVLGLVLQATLFRRFTWLVPDLVVLAVILGTLSLRAEAALVVGFLAGALVDVSLASSVLGLRALTYTVVAYLAIRTQHRADSGPLAVGVWTGLLTLVSVALLILIGLLFGQSTELGEAMLRRFIEVPVTNLIAGALLAIPVTRFLQSGGRRT
ncbi:MAG: rod shape-determining protein MreD, partial [Acidimicrobiia bacterium]